MEKCYLAIDLKSFYASVECVARGLDSLKARLVVADATRTEKTICLAVSPALKELGLSGRARLFEVYQKFGPMTTRKQISPEKALALSDDSNASSNKQIQPKNLITWHAKNARGDFLIAQPRMHRYIEVSQKIVQIYNRFVSAEDMHIYSIDEVFLDVTHYLKSYRMNPEELARTIVKEILRETGITATAGIGTNLYLAKIAMDIKAKHMPADENGVRVASLNEESYRRELWNHEPITDFWRIGPGYARRLKNLGITTMGELARYSLTGSEKLYSVFGVNAELIIDHAWGWEPVEIKDIKAYRSDDHSMSIGQVLPRPYKTGEARLIVQEMTDALTLDLVRQRLAANRITLGLFYDKENEIGDYANVSSSRTRNHFYPKIHSNATTQLGKMTNSEKIIMEKMLALFDQIAKPNLTVRKVEIAVEGVEPESIERTGEQMDLFTDYEAEKKSEQKERRRQEAVISIKNRYGKNAILRGINLEKSATMRQRNNQVGGHRA